VAQVSRLISK